jgi:hypothetical protein
MENTPLNKYLNFSEMGLIDLVVSYNKTISVVNTKYSYYVTTKKGFLCHSDCIQNGEILEFPKHKVGEAEIALIRTLHSSVMITHQIVKKVEGGVLVETKYRITPSFGWTRRMRLMNTVLKTIPKQPFAVLKENNSISLNVYFHEEHVYVTLQKNKSNDKLIRKFKDQTNIYDQLAYMALLVRDNKAIK